MLVWGVLILGDTYDLGDEASDVKDIGDWLDGWAVNKKIVSYKTIPILIWNRPCISQYFILDNIQIYKKIRLERMGVRVWTTGTI